MKESTFRIEVMRGTLYTRRIGSKCKHFRRSRVIGSYREIAKDFNNFGPVLSMSLVLTCLELKMEKMSSSQHETS